jgi:hypothetical protein
MAIRSTSDFAGPRCLAPANVFPMKRADDRWVKVRAYVVERLRGEVASRPHGGQAAIARGLGCSGPHLSNMLKQPPIAKPGIGLVRTAAARWGMTQAQLEAVACGEELEPSPGEDRLRQIVRDEIEAAIRERDGADDSEPGKAGQG